MSGRREPPGEGAGFSRVAVIRRQGKFLVAEPFFGAGPRVAVSREAAFDVGDLVLLRPPRGPGARSGGGRGGGRAQVARRLGRPDVARDVVEALMLDRGLARRFDPAVERQAREAAESAPADESAAARRDLRELATFTIDPATAKDFDDAISATVEGVGEGLVRVWVHIADVSAFVAPRSAIDREAHRRGTSVYVPGAVEPMLPFDLSNRACSLVPGVDRLTVTVEMDVATDGGEVRRAAFYRSVIRSDQRLVYEEVDEVFAGRRRAEAPWGEALAAARRAAASLGERRSARSALDLESSEPDFAFDRAGHVLSAEPSVQTESHRLIEHLMIAANEQVARVLEERGTPALYRVHERPEPPAVERLIAQLASLGVPTPAVPEAMTPQQAGEVVGEVSRLVAAWLARREGRGGRALNSLILRSLKQAVYDHRNRGHAGLASPRYCHFTSPIRRYPDLICHRGLLSGLDGSVPAPDGAWVAAAGPWCSERERAAMLIERDADDVARCFLLERELFQRAGEGGRMETFSGEVVGLIGAGAFVAFGERGQYQGMLPVRRLGGDWWEINEEATMLVGTRSGATLRLGETVEVRVESIDAPRGRVDLAPGGETAGG